MLFADSIVVVFNGHTGSYESYGFGDTANLGVYGVLSTMVPYAGTYYGLASPIGSIDGIAGYNSGIAFNTAAGAFEMTTAEDATFQAVVPAATPEPSSLMFLGTGMVGFAGVMRRRLWA
jgi:hypothetical protein